MKEGKILGAHCDCMAGLGESCSHVASLLWVLAVGVEKRDSLTVTQKTAYWVLPPAVRSVPYLHIRPRLHNNASSFSTVFTATFFILFVAFTQRHKQAFSINIH